MAKNGFKVMDSDMHVIEPPDLWQRYIALEFKEQAPVGTNEHIGDVSMLKPDGQLWGRQPMGEWNQAKAHDVNNNHGRFKPYADQGWTGEAQLKAMFEEGIDVAVLHPSRGLFALTIPDMDPRLASAMARAYTDWLYDFCQADTSSLLGAGMLSPFEMEEAIVEAHRCVEDLGFRGGVS